MLKNETFQELLFGGLNDDWKSVCRKWVNETKLRYHVATDQEAVASFSDREILPLLRQSATSYKNKSLIFSEFIGLPTPRFAIFVTRIEGQPAIVIYEGFLHLFRFLNEIHYFRTVRHFEGAVPTGIDGKKLEEEERKLYQSLVRITLEFLIRPFRLPSFYNRFPAEMQRKLDDEVSSMLAFAIFHELGHWELGHTSSSDPGAQESSLLLKDHLEIESRYQQLGQSFGISMTHYHPDIDSIDRSHPKLLYKEPLNIFKQQEFEADEYALRSPGENVQSFYMGAALFLYHLAFIERITPKGETHPMALNRLNHLETACFGLFSDRTKRVISGVKNAILQHIEYIDHNEFDYRISLEMTKMNQAHDHVQYLIRWMHSGLDYLHDAQTTEKNPESTASGRDFQALSASITPDELKMQPEFITGLMSRDSKMVRQFAGQIENQTTNYDFDVNPIGWSAEVLLPVRRNRSFKDVLTIEEIFQFIDISTKNGTFSLSQIEALRAILHRIPILESTKLISVPQKHSTGLGIFKAMVHFLGKLNPENIDRKQVNFVSQSKYLGFTCGFYLYPEVTIIKNEKGREIFNWFYDQTDIKEKDIRPLPVSLEYPYYILSAHWIAAGYHFGIWEEFKDLESLGSQVDVENWIDDFKNLKKELYRAHASMKRSHRKQWA